MSSTTASAPLAGARPTEPALGWSAKLGYAAGDFASCLYFGIFMNFLSYYYTDIVGLSAAAVGTMILVVRTWDWINDPMMGAIADRTRTRWGSFRPWILWMIGPYVAVGILTFTTFDLSVTGKLIYAYCFYTLLTMVYTAINIPYSALLGVMTARSDERTVLSSFRFVGAALGNLVVSSTMLYLIDQLGRGNDARGFTLAVAVYAVLAAGLFLVTFTSTRERIVPAAGDRISLRAELAVLRRNLPWLLMIGLSLVTIVAMAVRGGTTLYYFKYVSGREHWATTFLTLASVVQIGAVLLTKQIARMCGSKKAAFLTLTGAGAGLQFAFYFISPGNFPLIMAHQVAMTFVSAPLMPLFWSMIADTADYGAAKLGHRSTGLLFSAGTFSQKIGWSIGPAVALWLLSWFGFQANTAQSPATIEGLRLLMSFIPAAVSAVAMLVVWLYPIGAKMERELERAMQPAAAS